MLPGFRSDLLRSGGRYSLAELIPELLESLLLPPEEPELLELLPEGGPPPPPDILCLLFFFFFLPFFFLFFFFFLLPPWGGPIPGFQLPLSPPSWACAAALRASWPFTELETRFRLKEFVVPPLGTAEAPSFLSLLVLSIDTSSGESMCMLEPLWRFPVIVPMLSGRSFAGWGTTSSVLCSPVTFLFFSASFSFRALSRLRSPTVFGSSGGSTTMTGRLFPTPFPLKGSSLHRDPRGQVPPLPLPLVRPPPLVIILPALLP